MYGKFKPDVTKSSYKICNALEFQMFMVRLKDSFEFLGNFTQEFVLTGIAINVHCLDKIIEKHKVTFPEEGLQL